MHAPDPRPPVAETQGDMDPEEFRRHAHAVADWIADFLRDVGDRPVLPDVRPGDVAAALADHPPARGEPMEAILRDFERTIVPATTQWNHPGFLAYFANTASGPGILGEMLTAALNANAMLWRTAPAATEVELRTLDWLREMMGLGGGWLGTIQDTASVATLTALAAARERAAPGTRDAGLAGDGRPRLVMYCSEDAHSSVERAAMILGVGREGVRRIATDGDFRMRPDALARAVEEDVAAGLVPFAVVATVGTTSTTAIDPVPAIADVCGRHGLWLHVDAAYGGAAALLPEMRGVLDGCDRADSLVVNPHKWLFVPMDCSALYVRDPGAVRDAFSLVPEYLRTAEQGAAVDLMEFGPALGRRFRALKLWTTIRWFGAEGMAERIREHLRLARLFAGWVRNEPDWELAAPVPLSLVLCRHRPAGLGGEALDAHNRRIIDAANATGEVFLSHTEVDGRLAIRVAVGNLRTDRARLERAWRILRDSSLR